MDKSKTPAWLIFNQRYSDHPPPTWIRPQTHADQRRQTDVTPSANSNDHTTTPFPRHAPPPHRPPPTKPPEATFDKPTLQF